MVMSPEGVLRFAHVSLHAAHEDLTRAIQVQMSGKNTIQAGYNLRDATRALKGHRALDDVSAALRDTDRAVNSNAAVSIRLGYVTSADRHVVAALAILHAEVECTPEDYPPIPPPIALLTDVESHVRNVLMKHHNKGRFVLVPMFFVSIPEPPKGTAVYGIFSVDAKALQSGKPHFVKQDFIVYQPWDHDAKYYGGGPGSEPPAALCARFGPPHYGCASADAEPTDHWYGDEADRDTRLPREPEFRRLVADAIEAARTMTVT